MLQRRIPHNTQTNDTTNKENKDSSYTENKKRKQSLHKSQWTLFLQSVATSCLILVTLYVLTLDQETINDNPYNKRNVKSTQEKAAMLQEIRTINQNEKLGIKESFFQSLQDNGILSRFHTISNMTAQEQAIEWMLNYDSSNTTISSTSPYTFLQRYTILTFYFSTSPSQWKECSSYPTSKCHITKKNNRFLTSNVSECYWYGINCNKEKKVIWMDICDNSLNGVIPNEIFRFLTHLELLWLSENTLYGSIPSDVGNLNRLQSLSLFHTRIAGTIPEELYNLKELLSIRLYHTKLSGTISPSISKLRKLSWIWLHKNQFSGTFSMKHLSELYGLVSFTSFGNRHLSVEDEDVMCALKEYELLHLWLDCDGERGSCLCCTKCYQRHI